MSRWAEAVWRPSDAHGGTMSQHRGLVLHIAEGFYEGTLAWQHNAKNRVSSHFVIGRGSGQLAQVVDTDVMSWAQRAGNGSWLSVECEGFTPAHELHASHPGWEKLTDWQLMTAAKLLLHAHHQYGVPLQVASTPAGRGLGHHSMGRDWGHQSCPGPAIIAQKPMIVVIANRLNGQGNTQGEDDDMGLTVADIWEGDFGRGVRRDSPISELQHARDAADAAAAGVRDLAVRLGRIEAAIAKLGGGQ